MAASCATASQKQCFSARLQPALLLRSSGTLRTAAYVHALNRIGSAIEAQGTQRYFAEEQGTA